MSRARKVVLSANTSWNIFNFRAGLTRGLRMAGYEVVVMAPLDKHSTRLINELGCRYIRLPMDNKGTSPLRDLVLLHRYLHLLRRERPLCYLGFTVKPNIYGSLAAHMLGIPVINNISGLGTAFIRDGLLTFIVKRLYRLALAGSHTVFFQNPDDRDLFISEKLVRPAQAALLPGSGVDLQAYRPWGNGKIAAQQPPTFLLSARLIRDKGIIEYVEAARIVRQQHPYAQFQLLGFLDVENRTAISKETVKGWVEEGIVNYLGAIDDVRPYIAAADCVVLPSYREGLPRTLIEAAAMGKPLIATNVEGCREVVRDKVNGFLCRPKDARDLARAMLDFIALDANARQSMGKASRRLAEAKFDEKVIIARYLDALNNIVNPHEP